MTRKPLPAGLAARRCPFAAECGPERLVGVGFRCWLAGYRTGDIASWETAWTIYARALGPARAKPALSELASWVRLIKTTARREIEVYPTGCPGFCHDECLAVGMVAASQHGACPAMRACAVALLDSFAVDDVIEGATSFGISLRDADQVLSSSLVPLASRPQNGGSLPWH